MDTTRGKFTDDMKELQELPQGLGLLFEKTYPEGTRVDFCLGKIMSLAPSYMWRWSTCQ